MNIGIIEKKKEEIEGLITQKGAQNVYKIGSTQKMEQYRGCGDRNRICGMLNLMKLSRRRLHVDEKPSNDEIRKQ